MLISFWIYSQFIWPFLLYFTGRQRKLTDRKIAHLGSITFRLQEVCLCGVTSCEPQNDYVCVQAGCPLFPYGYQLWICYTEGYKASSPPHSRPPTSWALSLGVDSQGTETLLSRDPTPITHTPQDTYTSNAQMLSGHFSFSFNCVQHKCCWLKYLVKIITWWPVTGRIMNQLSGCE